MTTYRFHLEKYRHGSKIDCPRCGKKRCFIRYIDEQETVRFPVTVGKCDHEQSCGYHYTPREYFRDNPDALSNDDRRIDRIFRQSIVRTRPVPVEPSYISDGIVRTSMSHYDKNPLYRYLCSVFGAELEHFNIPNLGASMPSIHIWTDVQGEKYDAREYIDTINPVWQDYLKGEATVYELINDVFDPQEQVSPAQADLLILATGGPAQTRVGTGAGGSQSDLPWGGKKNTGRNR